MRYRVRSRKGGRLGGGEGNLCTSGGRGEYATCGGGLYARARGIWGDEGRGYTHERNPTERHGYIGTDELGRRPHAVVLPPSPGETTLPVLPLPSNVS